jgi:hypothetical protein
MSDQLHAPTLHIQHAAPLPPPNYRPGATHVQSGGDSSNGSGGDSPIDEFALTFCRLELGRVEPYSTAQQAN